MSNSGSQEIPFSIINVVVPLEFDKNQFLPFTTAFMMEQTVWNRQELPLDEFLPQLADLLNTTELSVSTAAFFQNTSPSSELRLRIPGPNRWVTFTIVQRSVALFRFGLGFLIIKVCPRTNSIEEWLDFQHYIRFTDGRRAQTIQDVSTEESFESLSILMTRDIPLEKDCWYPSFIKGQGIIFSILLVDGTPREEYAQLLCRVRELRHSRQAVWVSDSDLALENHALYQHSRNLWFQETRASVTCCGFDLPNVEFFRNTLPDRIENHYFLVFLFVLHQRFALTKLSKAISVNWTPHLADELTQGVFESLQADLLSLTGRCLTTQICHEERHQIFYRRLQDAWSIRELHAEVSEELREMNDFLIMRKTELLQRRLSRIEVLAALIGLPGLAVSFLGINISGLTDDPSHGMSFFSAICVTSVFLILGILLCIVLLQSQMPKREKRRHSEPTKRQL